MPKKTKRITKIAAKIRSIKIKFKPEFATIPGGAATEDARTKKLAPTPIRNWHVYILLCRDNFLYTGITCDVDRRMKKHASGTGAKFVRSHLPFTLVHTEPAASHSAAIKREAEIKRWPKIRKRKLFEAKMAEGQGYPDTLSTNLTPATPASPKAVRRVSLPKAKPKAKLPLKKSARTRNTKHPSRKKA